MSTPIKRLLRVGGAGLAALLASACASTSERFVLLPSPNGQPTAIVLKSNGTEKRIDQPYGAAQVRGSSLEPAQMDANEVKLRFAPALDALPQAPAQYLVYFKNNSDVLTPDSQGVFDSIKAELVKRPAAEIQVIGHTDTVGTVADNDTLSLQRARFVRDDLVAAGLPAERISIAGRGKREPLVQTADGVEEPRNRRVEIRVR